jgi:unsaturated chondroitin disaccharide hydrolase
MSRDGPATSALDGIDIDACVAMMARKLARYDDHQADKSAYPNEAKADVWSTVPASDWVSGFYPGALWYVYEFAMRRQWPARDRWRQRAHTWTAGLTAEQFTTTNHDLGFMIMDSFGHGYRLTGDEAYKAVVLQAAESLSKRFSDTVGLIRSWGAIDDPENFVVIIDNMMNLELLVWASDNGGPQRYRQVATQHADRSRLEFFRPDQSTYHVIDFNPQTGGLKRKYTHQGLADESCWSRGQTWAIYGYAYLFEATSDSRYLEQSVAAADYYLARLPADHVPPSDFDSGLAGLEYKDSSAAALASCAFFRLARLCPQPSDQVRFWHAAVNTLESLVQAPYFSSSPSHASALRYQARNFHADASHRLTNTSLIFGDYFLLEALLAYDSAIETTRQ